MIVDLVRNDLTQSAVYGSVKVSELFGVYAFRTVHHLVSTITAQLRPDATFAHLLRHSFPMGSMTGAPKIRAMQRIEQYETRRRGLFSGSIGYITPRGDMDFNVVIRSLLHRADGLLVAPNGRRHHRRCRPKSRIRRIAPKSRC